MENTLQLAAALVALVASGVGVGVAVDQLTLRSRLRKTEAWARESAATESDEQRRAALEALRLRSVAGVVGSHAVPLRYFAVTLLFPGMAVALLVSAFLRGEPPLPDLTALVFASVGMCGIEFRRCIRFYLERCAVANAYVEGGREVPGPRLDLANTIEGGVRMEFAAALGLSLGLNAVLVSAGMLYEDGKATFGPALLVTAVAVAGWALSWVKRRGGAV